MRVLLLASFNPITLPAAASRRGGGGGGVPMELGTAVARVRRTNYRRHYDERDCLSLVRVMEMSVRATPCERPSCPTTLARRQTKHGSEVLSVTMSCAHRSYLRHSDTTPSIHTCTEQSTVCFHSLSG